jgi:outer membrane biosynthesis protein TonB
MDEQARALVIVGALLMGASSSLGFAGGRMTAPEPPAEVRLVRLPPRIVRLPVEVTPIEPAPPSAAAEPAPVAPVEPAPLVPPLSVPAAPTIEAPRSPPKVEAKPKPQPPKSAPKPQSRPRQRPEKEQQARKPRPPQHKALPSCDVIKREYDAMTYAERMAAYYRASAEEVAHGRRCLGF